MLDLDMSQRLVTKVLGLQHYPNWTLGDPCLLCQWVLSPVNLLVPLEVGRKAHCLDVQVSLSSLVANHL